jgi:hypothetical protein
MGPAIVLVVRDVAALVGTAGRVAMSRVSGARFQIVDAFLYLLELDGKASGGSLRVLGGS